MKYNTDEFHFLCKRFLTNKTNYWKTTGGWNIYWLKKKILMWKKTMLKNVKSYKNNNMNSAKVNFIYLIKENFCAVIKDSSNINRISNCR